MNGTIRQRLITAFILLVVLPPVLVGSGLALQNGQNQREQAIFLQQQIGQGVAVQVESFIIGLERDLLEVGLVYRLNELPLQEQRTIFQGLMLFQDAFDELILVNASGVETLRVSQLNFVNENDFINRANDEAFSEPASSLKSYFSSIWFDEASGEPFITIAIPLINIRDGQLDGVLIAETRVKKMWDLLGTMSMGEGESVFIVDDMGRVVAHRNPSVVLRQTTYIVPQQDGENRGLDSEIVFSSVEELHFGDQIFYVVSERSVDVALAPARNMVRFTAVTVFLLLLVATFLAVVISRQIVRPIHELAATANEIRAGDFSVRVSVPKYQDEVRELALAFNSMADQLQLTMTGLEEHIQKLQTAEQRLTVYAANLERSNNELQSFAYVASHDLQEPLRKIRTFSDRMINQYASVLDVKGVDYLSRMESAAARMQGLIQDLLMFSRVTTKRQPFSQVDLHALVQAVLVDLELKIEETNADIRVGDLPVIEADQTQMRQLFQNLIDNALKFISSQTTPLIQILSESVQNDAGALCWKITVSDNGIGFDDKYTDRIFTIFQRLHGRQDYAGTGVGLAICRKIVERHDGCISAKSQVGQGASFIVILPEKREDIS